MDTALDVNKLCTPAKIYFVLATLSVIMMIYNRFTIWTVTIKLLFAVVWTYILGWLCKRGLTAVSWFIVLLPFILMFSKNKSHDQYEGIGETRQGFCGLKK